MTHMSDTDRDALIAELVTLGCSEDEIWSWSNGQLLNEYHYRNGM